MADLIWLEGSKVCRENKAKAGIKHPPSSIGKMTSLWVESTSLFDGRVCYPPMNHMMFDVLPKHGMAKGGLCHPIYREVAREVRNLWLTPTVFAVSSRSEEAMLYRKNYRESCGQSTVVPGNLAEQIAGSGAEPCHDMLRPTSLGPSEGKLNPDWVEWLMGFPIGWTKVDFLRDMNR